MQRRLFEVVNEKLVYQGELPPNESAGYLYFLKTSDQKTKVVLFESINAKNKQMELEYASIGKSDFGMLPPEKEMTKEIAEKFVAYVAENNQETPIATAFREGREETNDIIISPLKSYTPCTIITSEHACWVDQSVNEKNERRKLKTRIDIIPYEVTEEQFNQLLTKKYSIFNRAIAADLELIDGKPQLLLDGINLFDKANMIKFRGFNTTLLKFYPDSMMKMFNDVAKAVSSLQQSNQKEFTNADFTLFAKPDAMIAQDNSTVQKHQTFGMV